MKSKLFWIQFGVLLAGTLFAWGNFTIELIDWVNKRSCSTGCAIGVVNPFLTPCFYGACVFLLAFVLHVFLIVSNTRKVTAPTV